MTGKKMLAVLSISMGMLLSHLPALPAGQTITLKRYTRVTGYSEANEECWVDRRGWINMDVEDTTLVRETPKVCYGSYRFLAVSADGGRKSLIAFKALNRAIHTGSTITGVTLKLHPVDGRSSPEGEIWVYRVLASWRDGGSGPRPGPVYWAANHDYRYYSTGSNGIKWASPGAAAKGRDISRAPSFKRKLRDIYDPETNTITISSPQMLEDVRFWYGHYYLNYGWLIIYNAGGGERPVQVFHSSDVIEEELRPSLEITFERPTSPKPNDIDLNVTYISRTPRYLRYLDEGKGQYEYKTFRGHGVGVMKYPKFGDEKKWPDPGEEVTFTAHVKNKGTKTFEGRFDYKWIMNEKVVGADTFNGRLRPGEETTFEYKWKWDIDHSDHRDLYIVFQVDPDEKIKETTKNNNWLKKYIEARTLKYWVEKTLYNYGNEQINAWGSYSFEDYLQWHAHMWNETYMDKSRFDVIARDGSLERISLDEIEVVPDGLLDPWGKHTPKSTIESRPGTGLTDCHFDGEWGSSWDWNTDDANYEKNLQRLKNFVKSRAVLIEGSWIHECSHQCIAAFDVYWSNIEASTPSKDNGKCKLKDGGKYYITRGEFYQYPGIMGGGDTRPNENYTENTGLYSLHSVAGFNSNLPYRAGFFGEWQYDLPRKIGVKLTGGGGVPLQNAKVKIWQVSGNEIRDDDKYVVVEEVRADANGLLILPDQDSLEDSDVTTATGHTLLKKNPFGRIGVVGNNSNLLLRIEAFGQKDYRFLKLVYLNRGYWLGHRDYYEYPVKTNIVPSDRINWDVNVAEGKTVYSSKGQDTASKAADGDLKTAWSGGVCEKGDFIIIDLKKKYDVGAVRFVQDDGHGSFFQRFKIETSLHPGRERGSPFPDDNSFNLFYEETTRTFGFRMSFDKDVDPENENIRWVTYPGKPVPARWMKITATRDGSAKMDEIQVFAEK